MHMCVNNLSRVALDSGEDKIRTRDLVIARMDHRLTVIHLDTTLLISSANLQQNCLLLIAYCLSSVKFVCF